MPTGQTSHGVVLRFAAYRLVHDPQTWGRWGSRMASSFAYIGLSR